MLGPMEKAKADTNVAAKVDFVHDLLSKESHCMVDK